MSETALKLLEQIRALPEEDQAWIAEQLAPELPDLTEDPEFFAELQRRSDEAHAHPERLIDALEYVEASRKKLLKQDQEQ